MDKDKYSMSKEVYGIKKAEWRKLKSEVLQFGFTSDDMKKNFGLNDIQVWFLFDRLLQKKYNNLYIRNEISNPKVGDYVYCDFDGFGRGVIVELNSENIMSVKFENRDLNTMCSSKDMITIFDEVKRKITKL